MHRRDEAALKFRALLAGAKIAARVDTVPQVRVVGEERQLTAVAGFGELFPVADLRKPIDFIESLQDGLPFHLMNLLAAKEIRPPLHQSGF